MNGAIARVVVSLMGLVLLACERPPVDTVQVGYQGLGMEQVYNPRLVADQVALNRAPEPLPAVPAEGPPAGSVYQNVKVLSDLSVAEFTRLMAAMTMWVSPEQGCAYCHVGDDFASDGVYTKVVSRRMIEMTRHINSQWKTHVAGAGVTCYTCHRGQPVPKNIWFHVEAPPHAPGMAGNRAGQNTPAPQVGLTSLPYDPFTPFLDESRDIRVQSTTALPEGNRHSIKETEWTYALMMNISQSLGVNCTYCHNTRSFMPWEASTPARTGAWYGIRMVRDLNKGYLDPLRPQFPPYRLGPLGDAPKVNCGTCHQGAYKPLYGANMVKDYPSLLGPAAAAATAPPAQPTADSSAGTPASPPKQ